MFRLKIETESSKDQKEIEDRECEKMNEVTSAYIHIPFCSYICNYCDFPKLFYNENIVDQYLVELKKEIKKTYRGETLKTIYIGGGTPSSLSINQLRILFEMLNQFSIKKEVEYTIECNFDSLTKEKIDLFIKYGINRLSIGLETTSKKHLEYLGRTLNKEHVEKIIEYAKKKGISNINLDLIYALKDQTLTELKEDLDYIIALDITHISTYSLILEENTSLFIKKEENIDEDIDLSMYKFLKKYLKEKYYNHYEISNFSKKGYESKHNLVYWKNEEYYGFGLGASAYLNDKRINNTRSITKYLQGHYQYDLEKLSKRDKMNYEIILNLRLIKGIDKEVFFHKYLENIENIYDYQELIQNGLLVEEENHIYIKDEYLYLSNEIIFRFLEGETDEGKTF